jgi:RNA polymerase sigma-70 factor (ECF subfamily)
MTTPRSVTALLGAWSGGNPSGLNALLPAVYAELRRVAARQLRAERVSHTLQPTALVHELYLRFADQRLMNWRDRAHFFGVAAQMMRRILVDHARKHAAAKRGQGVQFVSVEDVRAASAASAGIPILSLDHALGRLQQIDAELARLVELRAFGGLTIDEAARVLEVSPSTVKRDWRAARAWLIREIGPS